MVRCEAALSSTLEKWLHKRQATVGTMTIIGTACYRQRKQNFSLGAAFSRQ
jgi:hypothetical protein